MLLLLSAERWPVRFCTGCSALVRVQGNVRPAGGQR